MRSKLTMSVLVAASLVGATTIASAQTQPAPGMSGGTSTHMKSTKSSKMKSGTTTGMSRGTMSRNPSSEGNVGPGTNNNNNPPATGKY